MDKQIIQNNKNHYFSDVLCTCTVPILLGFCRALGRSSDGGEPLISILFESDKPKGSISKGNNSDDGMKAFTSFRPILPRTLSYSMITPDSPSSPSALHAVMDFVDTQRERSPSPKSLPPPVQPLVRVNPAKEDDVNSKELFFNKMGSSFTKTKPWGFEIIPEQDHLKFSSNHLLLLFSLVNILSTSNH